MTKIIIFDYHPNYAFSSLFNKIHLFSQNLLSRRNFPHLSDIDGTSSNYTTSTSSSYRSEQDLVTSLVDKIRIESLGGKNCATSDASSERKLRKFSEV